MMWLLLLAAVDTSELEGLLDEAVIESASGSAQDHTTAPGFVTVISGESLRAHNIRSLDEALRYLAVGFNVVPHYDGAFIQVGARGLLVPDDGGTHVLVMLDGHALNNYLNGNVHLDEGLGVPMEAVDAIEIVLGPGSVLHGTNAMQGTINIITKRQKTVQAGVDAGTSADARAHVLASDDRWLVAAEYRFNRTAEVALPDGRAAAEGQVAGAVATLRLGDFRLAMNTAWRRMMPPLWGASFFDDGQSVRDSWNNGVDLSWKKRIVAPYEMGFRLQGDFFANAERGSYPASSGCPESMPIACQYRGRGSGTSIALQHTSRVDWLLDGAVVTLAGGELRYRFAQNGIDYRDLGEGTATENVARWAQHRASGALFLQQELRPTKTITINAGLRLELDQFFGAKVVPRIAFIGWVTDKTPIKLIYAEGFRAPTASEMEEYDPTYQLANRRLRPETVRSLDLIVERRFKSGYATVGASYSAWDDLIEAREFSEQELARATAEGRLVPGLDPALTYISDNVSSRQTINVNASFDARPVSDLSIGASASFNGIAQAWMPTFIGNARLSYEPLRKGHIIALATFVTSPYDETPWQVTARLSLSGPIVWKLRYRLSLSGGNAVKIGFLGLSMAL